MDTSNDPVVENPLTLVRCKSVIGSSISFVVLSDTYLEGREGSFILTSVSNNTGCWKAEKLLTRQTCCDVNIVTCKGLIVLYRKDDVYVYKPRTREIIDTVPNNLPCLTGPCGVGFDAKNGKYKLVRLSRCVMCQVLTLGSVYPFWRSVEMSVSWSSLVKNKSPIYASGWICWMVFLEPYSNNKGILIFKVESETFDLVTIPKEICGGDYDEDVVSARLVALQERMCVAKHYKREGRVEIWMMRERDWKREHNVNVSPISYCRYEISPLCIQNQRIFFQAWNFGLVSYHIEEKRFTTIYSSNARWLFQCGVYEEKD